MEGWRVRERDRDTQTYNQTDINIKSIVRTVSLHMDRLLTYHPARVIRGIATLTPVWLQSCYVCYNIV